MLNYTATLFNFVRNLLTVLRSGCTNLHSYQRFRRASFLSHPLQYLLFVDFLIMAIPIPKKGNVKEYSNYCTIALISHASKVMLKILQAGLQQHVNHELPDVQAGFKKRQKNQTSNCQHPLDHGKSKRVPEKHLFLFYGLCQSL